MVMLFMALASNHIRSC